MKHRRGFLAVLGTTLAFSAVVFAQNEKKQTDAQKKEIQSIVKIVDGAATGQAVPNDLDLKWVHEDMLKAQGNKEYVPFTVSIDPSKATGNLAVYWRVVAKDVPKDASQTGTAGQKKDDQKKDDQKKDDKEKDKKKSDYAYEDITFVPVTAGQAPLRISRSFTVPAGDYDVYVVAKEAAPDKAPKNAPPPKISLLKQDVAVPDFWNTAQLNTSTVIIASHIEPLPAPLTPQQQADRPYALGSMEIVPFFETKFTKNSELSTFMLIYNPKVDAANKPDITVEYNFYQKPAGQPEKFFNKTSPQNLNAQTLPPNFDFAAGHQLQTGQAVPLASFPEGDYRLEIKITDKIANKTLTRDVNFTVTS
jgi:hypothetical protein